MHPKSDLQISGEKVFFLRFANGGHGKAINSEKGAKIKKKSNIKGGVRTSK